MTALLRRWPLLLIVAGLTSESITAQPQTDGLMPYRATYGVFDDDKRIGQSVQTLSYDAASQRYTFESESRFRGLLRIAAPRPVVEHSEFLIANDRIQPVVFRYADGTRGGKRNLSLSFDWSARRMTVEQRENLSDVPVQPTTVDRGSVRVALMRELARGRRSGSHVLADPDVIRTYDYAVESTEAIETALGSVTTHRIRQERDGSSRHTLIWMAPSLGFVTLRMEQHRDDRDAISFVIESIDWLGENAPGAPD